VREIYGAEEAFEESTTSTAMPREPSTTAPAPLDVQPAAGTA